MTIAIVVLVGAGITFGYDRRQLVESVTALPTGQLPLPYPPPQPNAAKAYRGFRLLSTIDGIVTSGGDKNAKIIPSQVVGFSQAATVPPPSTARPSVPGPAVSIAPRPIITATVLADHGLGDDVSPVTSFRPDGSKKGVALIEGGIHAREWMAIEAVVRRLQSFQSQDFGTEYVAAANGTKPVGRDVFFAENVAIRFLPVVDPGGFHASQLSYSVAYEYPTIGNLGGGLVGGRAVRKNLMGAHGYVGLSNLDDPFAWFGVDPNRNWFTGAVGGSSGNPKQEDYRGWVPKDPKHPVLQDRTYVAPECDAVESAIRGLFDSPRPTGAAFLDLHTYAGGVVPPPVDNPPLEVSRFTKLVLDASRTVDPTMANLGDTYRDTRGTAIDMAAKLYGIPALSIELPAPPDPTLVKDLVAKQTFESFKFIPADPNDLGQGHVKEPDFGRQIRVANAGIDAALDFAAGPPYLARVLILQQKTGDGVSFAKAAASPASAEIVYDRTWVRDGTNAELRVLKDNLDGIAPTERWLNSTAPAQLVLQFSKPMRTKDTADEKHPLTGLDLVNNVGSEVYSLLDQIKSTGGGRWISGALLVDGGDAITPGCRRYDYDTWIGQAGLDPQKDGAKTITFRGAGRLQAQAEDQVQLKLDGRPSSVAVFDRSKLDFASYEDGGAPSGEANDGGKDRSRGNFEVDNVRPLVVKVP